MSKGFSFLLSSLAAGICLTSTALAAVNTVPVQIKLNNKSLKTVQLIKITPSKAALAQLSKNIQFTLAHPQHHVFKMANGENMPSYKYVGMHGLPVLDQGRHGSCATFASTEGVDSVFPLQDNQTVSQLCNLELGKTLGNGSNGGWNGSFGHVILRQIQEHGYLTMEYQKKNGCGGLTEYPVNDYRTGTPMDKKVFEAKSNRSFTSADWKTLWKYNGSFQPIDQKDGEAVLAKVKKALNNDHVVVFGTVLNAYAPHSQAGAIGSYKGHDKDAWVLTDEMFQINAGHEMVIDGYDDNACATYQAKNDQGQEVTKKQCGLLRLRNSWGAMAGNSGDYYMSYDFFERMAIEDYELGKNVNA